MHDLLIVRDCANCVYVRVCVCFNKVFELNAYRDESYGELYTSTMCIYIYVKTLRSNYVYMYAFNRYRYQPH